MTDKQYWEQFRDEVNKHMAQQEVYGKTQSASMKKMEKTIEEAFKGIDLQAMKAKVDGHSKVLWAISGVGTAVAAVWVAFTREFFK